MHKIVLGTVQFGLDYGVANVDGQVPFQEAESILSTAWKAGVRTLDTAVLYGQSESMLGHVGVSGWDVVTKLPEMPEDVVCADGWVQAQVTGSTARLRLDALDGLLLHRPAQLRSRRGEELYRALLSEREKGRVRRIGVSVYGPEELEGLPAHMKFDIVQAPWNVLDQRMTRSGWVARLHEEGCEFHARSVFLQGLLLMTSDARPARFSRWQNLFDAWDRWLAATEISPLQACMSEVFSTPDIDRVVVGVDSALHLTQILTAAANPDRRAPLPPGLISEDPELLNPALWKTA